MSEAKDKSVLIIFRSRVDESTRAEYEKVGARMLELAQQQPGFLGIKTFVADDGERVSISEFASMEHAMAWRAVPEHQEAQAKGRSTFYTEFDLATCTPLRRLKFRREKDA